MAQTRPGAWISWSSGKDSALALHAVRSAGEVEVIGLVTTVSALDGRVAMHGVRRALVDAQARALRLPLHIVELPWPCPNDVYEARMSAALRSARAADVEHLVFGDLFLEDIRAYREQSLCGSGISALFPLWHRPTAAVAGEILDAGIRAVLTCVDPAQAPSRLVGLPYDRALLAALPEGVDPCGENGEFHTFVTDGPGFAQPIHVAVGEIAGRDGFVVADVTPAAADHPR